MFWSNFAEVTSLRRNVKLEQNERAALSNQTHPNPTEGAESLGIFEEQNSNRARALRVYLGSKYVHEFAMGLWGTLPGIFLAVLLASTIFGADFRWDFWKMLALQEPRRVRILLAKFLVLGVLILIALVVLLGTSYGFNALFLRAHSFKTEAAVFPSFVEIGSWLARAFLSSYSYAAVAGLVVVAFESALGGSGVTLGFLAIDSLLFDAKSDAPIYHFSASPAQQVANLFGSLPDLPLGIYGIVWFSKRQTIDLIQVKLPQLHLQGIPPSPVGALIVLGAVVVLAVLCGSLLIRRKEF